MNITEYFICLRLCEAPLFSYALTFCTIALHPTMVFFLFQTGFRNFVKDIEMMIGKMPWIVWAYYGTSWCVVTPAAIVVRIYLMFELQLNGPLNILCATQDIENHVICKQHKFRAVCISAQSNQSFPLRKHAYIMLTPLNSTLYSKTGVYRGIHYFSYFFSKT